MVRPDRHCPKPAAREFRQLLEKTLTDQGMILHRERYFAIGTSWLVSGGEPSRTFGLKANGDFSDIMQGGQGGGPGWKQGKDIGWERGKDSLGHATHVHAMIMN
jgi:hypothetical protein